MTTFSNVVADPHIIGFEFDRFDFMGEDGHYYNLLSTSTVQVNVLIKQSHQSRRGFTHMDAVGVKIGHKDIGITMIEVGERRDSSGFPKALINGEPLTRKAVQFDTGLRYSDGSVINGFAEINERGQIQINTGNYMLGIERLKATEEVPSPYYNVSMGTTSLGMLYDGVFPHGVVGQTADFDGLPRRSSDKNGAGAIDGHYTDYEVSDLFADDFKYNRFGALPMTKKVIGAGVRRMSLAFV